MSAPNAGWNPDPTGRHEYRFWDGTGWTDDVADGGVTSTDPLAGPDPSGAAGAADHPVAGAGPVDAGAGVADAGQAGSGAGGYDPSGVSGAGGYGAYDTPGAYDQPGGYPAGSGDPAGGYPAGSGAPAGGYDPADPGAAPGPGGPAGPGGYDPFGPIGPYGPGAGQPPATSPRSRAPVGLLIGLAVGAVVIIVVLAVVLLGGDDDDPVSEGDSTSEDSEPQQDAETQDVFTLAVGDCVTDSSLEGEVSEVSIVDCSQPHVSEVFHTYEMPESPSLPDEQDLVSIVGEQCQPAFESFVGVAYADSELEFSYLSPTPESWDSGDRELLCLIHDPTGSTTGSLEGAAR